MKTETTISLIKLYASKCYILKNTHLSKIIEKHHEFNYLNAYNSTAFVFHSLMTNVGGDTAVTIQTILL